MLTIFEELVSVAICSRSNLRSTGLLGMKAMLLFNILETIADNLRALSEFTSI